MNYQRIYDEIINRAKTEQESGIRKRKNGNYYENHHIIPRCMGGTNDKSNLVLLTAKEHFLCHIILCEIYKNDKWYYSLYHAVWKMIKGNIKYSNYIVNSRTYERLRNEYINVRKNIIVSDETRKKISDAIKILGIQPPSAKGKIRTDDFKRRIGIKNSIHRKGKPSTRKGIPASEETKQKIREKRKLQIITNETKQKISESNKGKHKHLIGRKLSDEHKQNIKNGFTDEVRKKMSDSHIGIKKGKWSNEHRINMMNALTDEVRKKKSDAIKKSWILRKLKNKKQEVNYVTL